MMLKNWSRIALASFLVLMVGTSVAFATTARVRSLANTGDYISDDSAVNRWYSTLPSFGNQVNAELGQWDGNTLVDTRGLGWTHACGEDGTWGTYRISLNENAIDHPGFWMANPFYSVHMPGAGDPYNEPPILGGAWDDTPINKWDIAGGWELGETMGLGVSITHSKWNAEDTAAEVEASNSFLTFGAGFTWTNNDNMVFDASFTYGMAGGDATYPSGTTTNTVEWDSGTAIDIAARLFYDWKDNVTLVPMAEFATSEYSLKQSDTPALAVPNGSSTTDIMIGLGLNMDVNQDNMLVFALEYMNRSFEYANPDTAASSLDNISYQYMPTVRLALETQITSWFTTRIGAAKYLGSVEVEDVGGDSTKETPGVPGFGTGISGFDWFLGCGFSVAEWTIDLELNHETPFNVGYWLTGYSNYATGAGPVARIAGTYNY